ncbi:GNAT family N-acetyltransferase [Chitinophaga solisilvae]|uniref:GNAT family N-acetyltransferase n=1 Tax=Chitinophaga solisilvae TaxID=1233460 RepID=A0A433WF04_9BACT|nr:GNAT family N-acetyltransferase [Chitinophaga solisilvae]NSL89605.1 GNAT family N-acetyltransferase [Chitinophaga solisilvae]
MLPLQTSRLLVFPCRLPVITEIYLQDPHAAESLQARIPPEWPLADLKEQLPHLIETLQDDPKAFPWLLWVIIDAKDKTLIGDVGFKGRPDKNGVVEIGYSLLPQFRDRGYMQEAATALVHWAFQQPHVKKVVAECDVTNTASRRVLEKLGMQENGMTGEMIQWRLLRGELRPIR